MIRFHHVFPRGSNTSYYSFTFLTSPLPINEQFDAMGTRIRSELGARYNLENRLDMLVEMIPANGVVINASRTIRNINGITGEFLHNFYLNILQSNETIQLEGLRIRIRIVGSRMVRRRGRGRGRTTGSNHLPAKYRGMGLACHEREPESVSPCLVRAVMLGFRPELRGI